MKTLQKLLVICFFILPVYLGISQSQSINYKALIRDNTGTILANDLIIVQFSILQGDSQTIVYSENHTPTTDANGLVILNIGEGTILNGDYTAIDWASDTHFLNVQVNTGSGLVDMGTTQFLSVPYALHAQTAENTMGLEDIDEGNGIGWRLKDRDPDNYGNIGENAIDLSITTFPNTNRGATGDSAFAVGGSTIASGDTSFAIGSVTEASGTASFAAGGATTASGTGSVVFGSTSDAIGDVSFAQGIAVHTDSFLSVAFGRGNIGGGSPDTWVPTDPLFEIGIGQPAGSDDDNALTVYKNGNIAVADGRVSIAETVGENAIAFGNSRSIGTNTVAYGDRTIAQGQNTFAGGTLSSTSGENSMAIGDINSASGVNSFVMGRNNSARAFCEAVFGSFAEFNFGSADTFEAEDQLFVVANGTDSNNRSNAITVLKNGNTGIGTSEPQERLHIANGRLRIGTETVEDTGSNRLEWNSSLFPDTDDTFQLGGSALRWEAVWATDGTINTSDRREKKDIKGLKYGLREILDLNPVSFRWKAKPEQGEKLGLIAQDILEIIPEVVKTHEYVTTGEGKNAILEKKELDRLGVYYTDLIPVLIKAIQDQQGLIQKQQHKIETLETKTSEISDLKNRMTQLEASLKTTIQ